MGGGKHNLIRKLAVVSGQTLYCSQQHLWLRFRRLDGRVVAPENKLSKETTDRSLASASAAVGWKVQVGITERGLEDIGDITAIDSLMDGAAVSAVSASQSTTNTHTQKMRKNRHRVERDAALIQIQWEAHRITTADELYHTSWDTLADTTTIRSPLAGRLTTMFVAKHTDTDQDFDTEDPLFELCLDDEKTMNAATTTTNTTQLTSGNNKNNGSDTDGDGSGVPELVDWKTYQQRIQSLERGKFYDEDIL